ncbi:hypothetical protein Pfo_011026 [Paulownia fortunei]|nr:hypothetical protein Pfo_011026 [Paulownia fortunei]
MAKREPGACTKKDNKCSSIDRISMLPDELLVFILSFLPLKEATATSILSCRWRYLWTFMPILDFDGTESLLKVELAKTGRQALLDKERWKYVRWVNHVLSLHNNSTIEELRVLFTLAKTHKRSIEKWLRYALARKVQRLELNLTDDGSMRSRKYDEYYTFPYKLLRTDKGSFSNRSQPTSWSMRQSNSIDFKYLKRISMNYVNVNGEALEFFLCNCPLLEHLSVSQSRELLSVKISGPFHSLKRLKISLCPNLKSVEIRDANLVYLKYNGSRIHFHLENVPLLVEIFLGGMVTNHMKDVLWLLSSHLPQLEIFTIEKTQFSWEETKMFYSAVKMSNLKQLVVKSYADEDCSLLPLTNLIRASPCLQRFVLKALWMEPMVVKRKVRKVMTSSYTHLKEVEFVGYYGQISDLELVVHFLENGVALEKIVVDPREPCDYRLKDNDDIKEEMAARTRARRQLTKKVAPGINLNIL